MADGVCGTAQGVAESSGARAGAGVWQAGHEHVLESLPAMNYPNGCSASRSQE